MQEWRAGFERWEARRAAGWRADSLWTVLAYRLALYAAISAWPDVSRLARCRITIRVSSQLYGAIGSIGANIADGYGRLSKRDRVRFYEYAVCSAREARSWYELGRPVLGEQVVDRQLDLLREITALLVTTINRERS